MMERRISRYSVAMLLFFWLVGNIPAWLFCGTYHSSNPGHPIRYWGMYWTAAPLIVGIVAFGGAAAYLTLREFSRWVVGENTRQLRSQRIERLERELGIGQD